MKTHTSITVRYAETDQMGITHHANYAVWYEVARTEFIKNLGINYSEIEQEGILLPVVELNCKYAGSCGYEDELTVETSLGMLTAARLRFDYKIYKKCAAKPINSGHTLHAWVDKKTFKPVNIKKINAKIYDLLLSALEPEND